MTELRKKLRFRFSTSVPAFLRSLGVKYKKGQAFWANNEGELEYIYHDFKQAARQRKAQLHPDAGGDSDQFAEFSACCDAVEKSFNRRGIGVDRSAASSPLSLPDWFEPEVPKFQRHLSLHQILMQLHQFLHQEGAAA